MVVDNKPINVNNVLIENVEGYVGPKEQHLGQGEYTTQYNTIQYNTIQYNTIRYDTIRYDTIRYDTIRYDTTRHDATRRDATRRDATRRDATRRDATRRDATRRDATRRDATRRDAMRCDAMRYDTIRYDTMRCDTIRFDTIRYNTIQIQYNIPLFRRSICMECTCRVTTLNIFRYITPGKKWFKNNSQFFSVLQHVSYTHIISIQRLVQHYTLLYLFKLSRYT